ncbi:uncharacterized protein LOC134530119 isoform X2 [Bacillus rossius redtenbacheri]|uniref:uncharacterized protein LOC134530119 isoform X2 n=1 Tax=Bacillus rossius redtenbacheri TaxID=93214 RepID=UPI002FDCA432
MSGPAAPRPPGASPPLQVVCEARYEAEPPSNIDLRQLVEHDGAGATTKEEEWVTRKKTELTTTRQIETRVKRQLVLEAGRVVQDSGPVVTTSTTEDTETQESRHTERRSPDEADGPREAPLAPGPEGLVKEVKEKVVKSREHTEERIETEDVVHLGDLAEEDYVTAVRNQQDVRQLLLEKAEGRGGQLASLKDSSRVLHQSSKSHKVVDTKDSHKLSAVGPDGRLITETKTTHEHEEIRDREDPDDGEDPGDGEQEVQETRNESSHRFHKSRDEEVVEYLADGVKIGEEMRYQAENVEGERRGDPDTEWDSLSTRIRRMRRQGGRGVAPAAAATTPLDRKDALTRRPLDFDQEEETRKAETSKWLEHHFGSDSRSSKDSLADEDDPPAAASGSKTSFINVTMKSRPLASSSPLLVNGGAPSPASPGYVATTVNTSSRVFVSSPEPEGPPRVNGYFKGVSDWSERSAQRQQRVQVLPTGPNHTFTPREEAVRSPRGSSDHLERGASPGYVRTAVCHTSSSASAERVSSPFLSPGRVSPARASFPHNGVRDDDDYPTPPRRRYADRTERSEDEARQEDYRTRWEPARSRPEDLEPPPDYSPPPATTPSPSPPPEPAKKVYQRTRFAADIPPASSPRSGGGGGAGGGGAAPKASGSKGSFLGDSFRRLVTRLRSTSAERKAARARKSRSPPRPQQSSTYQQYHVVDSNLPSAAPRQSPPQPGRERTSAGRAALQDEDQPDAMDRGARVVHRYYLGEDPFGGSIYGREREYDGVVPARSRRQRQHSGGARDEPAVSRVSSSTLGRLSKSTSRLVSDGPAPTPANGDTDRARSAQTLPRKLLYEKRQQQSSSGSSSQWQQRTSSPGLARSPHSSSLINVSFVNHVAPAGPVKPARSYRSSLARSKSFSAHAAGEEPASSSLHRSNPQLHRLDESPPPLKSPGILASISRSQRDLGDGDAKRRVFMRGLQDRAPELFRTLHGDEGPSPVGNGHGESFRSSSTDAGLQNGTRSVVRRGSPGAGDFSETVRVTSRSRDPARPGVTDTVQSFSKKTVPTRGGLSTETVESSETTTVTESRVGAPARHRENGFDRYPGLRNGGGGVVIKVRPGRK